jgi:hypothetical protein
VRKKRKENSGQQFLELTKEKQNRQIMQNKNKRKHTNAKIKKNHVIVKKIQFDQLRKNYFSSFSSSQRKNGTDKCRTKTKQN